jgi:hypothetical protein
VTVALRKRHGKMFGLWCSVSTLVIALAAGPTPMQSLPLIHELPGAMQSAGTPSAMQRIRLTSRLPARDLVVDQCGSVCRPAPATVSLRSASLQHVW